MSKGKAVSAEFDVDEVGREFEAYPRQAGVNRPDPAKKMILRLIMRPAASRTKTQGMFVVQLLTQERCVKVETSLWNLRKMLETFDEQAKVLHLIK